MIHSGISHEGAGFFRRRPALALASVAILCAPGCTPEPVVADNKNETDVVVETDVVYTDDGIRSMETYLPEEISGYYRYTGRLISRCDGADLLEIYLRFASAGGGSATRTVRHPACDDGRLTPSDFISPK